MMVYINQLQTEEQCLEAVRQNPRNIRYIKHKTFEICFEAIILNKHCIWLLSDVEGELFNRVYTAWRLMHE